jgi:hypothetical protein
MICDTDDLLRGDAQFELMASWQSCSVLSLPVAASCQADETSVKQVSGHKEIGVGSCRA